MGLKDSSKNNLCKGQYKEQFVQRTQRTNCVKDSTKNNRYKRTVQITMGSKNSTKNTGFNEQYKKQWV